MLWTGLGLSLSTATDLRCGLLRLETLGVYAIVVFHDGELVIGGAE